eukprot:Blabericola_migrator_1__975@NODE_1243_length_5009_cov_73_028329_g840_i0_p5_GENE_NODE_1243_length_5009_cov_73_028329_g840_i0NODE_1243_length_5009_cov_73_028329_g840_i0_p5_ORF_typecomplete_len165_score14_72_NODE_1243_length_5009_cov_73_028329_g840_i0359853
MGRQRSNDGGVSHLLKYFVQRGLAARATLPYWTEWGSPDMSGLLYRIDTFHPQWDLVRVAVYKQSWLAIFTLDPHTVNVMQSQENPFWLKGGQPTDPFPPSPWQMEGLDVETPPENMIALKEVTVNKVEGEVSYTLNRRQFFYSLLLCRLWPSSFKAARSRRWK